MEDIVMTQENKELLLKDLCARLPYGVKGQAKGMIKFFADEEVSEEPWTLTNINAQLNKFGADTQTGIPLFNTRTGKCNFKPYLFPMSSMTDEQWRELFATAGYEVREEDCGRHTEMYYYQLVGHENELYPNSDAIDWLNKNHFDYQGLIEKGLAIDATGLNIY